MPQCSCPPRADRSTVTAIQSPASSGHRVWCITALRRTSPWLRILRHQKYPRLVKFCLLKATTSMFHFEEAFWYNTTFCVCVYVWRCAIEISAVLIVPVHVTLPSRDEVSPPPTHFINFLMQKLWCVGVPHIALNIHVQDETSFQGDSGTHYPNSHQ